MGRLIRFSSSALRRLLLFSPPLPLVFSGILWSSFFSPSSSSADADIVRTGTQRGNLNRIDPMRRSRRSGKRHGFPSHSRRKAPSPPLSLSLALFLSLSFSFDVRLDSVLIKPAGRFNYRSPYLSVPSIISSVSTVSNWIENTPPPWPFLRASPLPRCAKLTQ